MTIENLAVMIKKGFAETGKKFAETAKKKEVDKQISDLARLTAKNFASVDKRFEQVDKNFASVDKRFESVFSLLMEKPNRDELEEKADKRDIDRLLSAIDNYASKADTYFQEMLMLAHKVDRLERWILQIAKKVNVPLEA